MKRNSGYFSATSKHSNDKSKSAIQSPASEIESPPPAHKSKPAAAAKTMTATKGRKSEIQSITMPIKSSDPPVSRLVRRVQAVVTVKSEEDDEEEFETSLSRDNERDPTFQPKQVATGRRKSNRVILEPEDDEESQPLHPASDDELVRSDSILRGTR